MSLVPAVTELLLAEFMYLQFDDPSRPIYLYINSTGVQARTLKNPTVQLLLEAHMPRKRQIAAAAQLGSTIRTEQVA